MKIFILILFSIGVVNIELNAALPTSGIGPESQVTRELKTNAILSGWAKALGVLTDTISVTDWGATGNGVTDDTIALTRAFTYLHTNNIKKQLHFPPGCYIITNSLLVTNYTSNGDTPFWISGSGAKTTILNQGKTPALVLSNAFHFRISDLSFAGTNDAVFLNGSGRGRLERLTAQVAGNAFVISNSFVIVVDTCKVWPSSGSSLLNCSDGVPTSDNIGHAFWLKGDYANDIKFIHCDIGGSVMTSDKCGYRFSATDSLDISVIGGVCEGGGVTNSGYALNADNCSMLSISEHPYFQNANVRLNNCSWGSVEMDNLASLSLTTVTNCDGIVFTASRFQTLTVTNSEDITFIDCRAEWSPNAFSGDGVAIACLTTNSVAGLGKVTVTVNDSQGIALMLNDLVTDSYGYSSWGVTPYNTGGGSRLNFLAYMKNGFGAITNTTFAASLDRFGILRANQLRLGGANSYELDVVGVGRVQASGNNFLFKGNTTEGANWQAWFGSDDTRFGYFGYGTGGDPDWALVNERASGDIIIIPGSGGNVGIRTNAPQTTLHVHGSVTVTNDLYDATVWNGNLTVPTKDALRDKIESMGAGGGSGIATNSGTGFNNTFTNALFLGTSRAGTDFSVFGVVTTTNGISSGSIYSSGSGHPIGGITSEQNIFTNISDSGSRTIPAGTLTDGKVIRINMSGVYSTDVTTPGTLTVRVRIIGGGITNTITTGARSPVINQTLQHWDLTLNIVRTDPAVETFAYSGKVVIADGLFVPLTWPMDYVTELTVDADVDQNVEVSAQWSSADTDNLFHLRTGTIELLR